MLIDLVTEIGNELKMQEFITNPAEGHYKVTFKNDTFIMMIDYSDRYILKGNIGPLPKEKTDAILTRIMDANLFGKGVNGGVIGMENDGIQLCMTFTLPIGVNYKMFKEKLTILINSIAAWRKILESSAPEIAKK